MFNRSNLGGRCHEYIISRKERKWMNSVEFIEMLRLEVVLRVS